MLASNELHVNLPIHTVLARQRCLEVHELPLSQGDQPGRMAGRCWAAIASKGIFWLGKKLPAPRFVAIGALFACYDTCQDLSVHLTDSWLATIQLFSWMLGAIQWVLILTGEAGLPFSP
jgi:hypothetical protein